MGMTFYRLCRRVSRETSGQSGIAWRIIPDMPSNAAKLVASVRILLRTFTINETAFPPAEGKLKHNAHDFQTILFLANHPNSKANRVADFLGVVPTTAQSVIERLIRRGIVVRKRGDSSREGVSLSLTTQGQVLCEAIDRQDLTNCERMLRALPASERAGFVKNLQLIAESIEDEVRAR